MSRKIFLAFLLISAAGLAGACDSSRTTDTDAPYRTPNSRDYPESSSPAYIPPPPSPRGEPPPLSPREAPGEAQFASPDARILSILHAKNQEEVQIGQLAQRNGSSADTKAFGKMLETDHTANDAKVNETASLSGITLVAPQRTAWMLQRESGMSGAPQDPVAELSRLQGPDFDRAFAQKMLDGHRELIQIVQSAEPNLRDQRVRDFLDQTLPKLREHESMAAKLARQ